MPTYEHQCRDCDLEWLEFHRLEDFDAARHISCPDCEKEDTFICVTTSGAIQFKGGGWSPQGYNKHTAYDQWGKDNLELFDRKEDCERVMKGEAKQAEARRLKRLDRAAKRHFGGDAGLTQADADKALAKAEKEVKV
jgi:putative FmdB family regulatory protein